MIQNRLVDDQEAVVAGGERQDGEASIMRMLTATAVSLFKTAESIATPCSVKTFGAYFRCLPRSLAFKVPVWYLQE